MIPGEKLEKLAQLNPKELNFHAPPGVTSFSKPPALQGSVYLGFPAAPWFKPKRQGLQTGREEGIGSLQRELLPCGNWDG